MTSLNLSLVLLFGSMASTVVVADPPSAAGAPIPLFVKSAQATGGFTDPDKGRADSVKNLVDRLKNTASVRLVPTPEEAVIVLEVLGREKKPGRSVLWGRKEEVSLGVQVTAGEYSAEFTGASNTNKGFGVVGNYGRAAGEVVKQLDAWVKANQEPLQALRAKKEVDTAKQ
jgi:hypothetical protein